MADDSKPRLTVMVGAGASICAGIPSTWELTKAVMEKFRRPRAGWVRLDEMPDYQERVKDFLEVVDRHCSGTANFEHMLELLEWMESMQWYARRDPDDKRGPLGEFGFITTCVEGAVASPRAGMERLFEFGFLETMTVALFEAVGDTMREASRRVPDGEHWQGLRGFWRALAEAATLTVVTTNYDTVVDQALDLTPEHQGFSKQAKQIDGEDIWKLDPQRLYADDSHRLLHLHGSIHFGRKWGAEEPGLRHKTLRFHDLDWLENPEDAAYGHAQSGLKALSGRMLNVHPFVTGFQKTDKLIAEPYGSYYEAAADQLNDCDRLLVIGYGFGDPHLNRLLNKIARRNGERRIAVVDRSTTNAVQRDDAHGDCNGVGIFLQTSADPRQPWDRHPLVRSDRYPWTSETGQVRFYWDGVEKLLEPAAWGDLVGFLMG